VLHMPTLEQLGLQRKNAKKE